MHFRSSGEGSSTGATLLMLRPLEDTQWDCCIADLLFLLCYVLLFIVTCHLSLADRNRIIYPRQRSIPTHNHNYQLSKSQLTHPCCHQLLLLLLFRFVLSPATLALGLCFAFVPRHLVLQRRRCLGLAGLLGLVVTGDKRLREEQPRVDAVRVGEAVVVSY